MTKTLKIILIASICLAFMLPSAVNAQKGTGFQLVPCGSTGQLDCTFKDLIFLIYRIINLLLAVSGIIAVVFMFLYSFRMVSSLGEPEAIAGAKQGLARAVIGFSIILLSFVIIGVFLTIFGIDCKPWEIAAWGGDAGS